MSNPIANKGRATESATVAMLTDPRRIITLKTRSQGPSTLIMSVAPLASAPSGMIAAYLFQNHSKP